jgi:hypothetical protein
MLDINCELILIINLCRANGFEFKSELAENITSEAGHKLQRQVWEEMLQVFDAVIPEASTIVKSRV